jgi:hypothetical protein
MIAGAFIPIILKISIMLEAFKDWLDQIYWSGYAQAFLEDNPDAFYRQLEEFTEQHQTTK